METRECRSSNKLSSRTVSGRSWNEKSFSWNIGRESVSLSWEWVLYVSAKPLTLADWAQRRKLTPWQGILLSSVDNCAKSRNTACDHDELQSWPFGMYRCFGKIVVSTLCKQRPDFRWESFCRFRTCCRCSYMNLPFGRIGETLFPFHKDRFVVCDCCLILSFLIPCWNCYWCFACYTSVLVEPWVSFQIQGCVRSAPLSSQFPCGRVVSDLNWMNWLFFCGQNGKFLPWFQHSKQL